MGRGLSTFDLLGDLPASQRTLMRLFLRRIRLSADELNSAVAELPEEKRLNHEELHEALAALLTHGWISQGEQDGRVTYTIQQQSTTR